MIFTLLALCLTLAVEPGHVKRVLDADTFALYDVDVGGEVRVRVLDVDGYELIGGTDSTKALARAGREFTRAWLARGPFALWACERDSFGRLLARIQRGQESLGEALVAGGFAKWR